MKRSLTSMLLVCVGATTIFLGMGWAQDLIQPVGGEAGVDPQTRGPIHEAFAEPTIATPPPAPIVPKQPPGPIEEAPPDEKPQGNNVQWIPGYWIFDDEQADFLWVSGFWRDVPPERRWVAGYWSQLDDNGWQRVSGYWESIQRTEVEYLPAPPHNIDAGPSIPAPAAQSVYIPGCWVHREERYLWRPGHWTAVQEGWVYSPARYYWTPAGFLFCEGHWDYPLESRGLLFCPVRIEPETFRRPGWVYRPHYCVSTPALFTALFVRPAFGHYYFGDYFAHEYDRAGFVPWVNYTVVRNTPNPLYAYYHAREDRNWDVNIKQIYVDRREGRLPPPPASLAQQTQTIQNISQITNVNNQIRINQQNYRIENKATYTQQLTMLAPISQVTQVNTTVKMQPVSMQTMVNVQKQVAQIRQVSAERMKFDIKQAQVAPQVAKPGEAPPARPTAKFTLPRPTALVQTAPEPKAQTRAVPAPPVAPKPVAVKPPTPKVIQPQRLEAKPNVIAPKRVESAPVKIAPKTEKETKPSPQPKEEKKATPQPKQETKPAPPPPVKDEKKATPQPKQETKPAPPPPAKEEKKVAPQPKQETKPAPPPPPPPPAAKEEKKVAPAPPKEEKKSPPPPPKKEEKKAATSLKRPLENAPGLSRLVALGRVGTERIRPVVAASLKLSSDG